MTVALEYELPYPDTVRQITEIVQQAVQGPWRLIDRLNDFEDCIFIKNLESVLVHTNTAYEKHFSPCNTPIGRSGDKYLGKEIVNVSHHTDNLILNGSNSLECEHIGRSASGTLYGMRTYKHNLSMLGNPGFAIMGVTRLERVLSEGQPDARVDLAERHRKFQLLSESDREISRLIGMGVTGRAIAEQLGMTIRTVELRKKKVLEALGLDQTIDLVKLLVRLQDRGFLDLGL